jgi:hypothetical protein
MCLPRSGRIPVFLALAVIAHSVSGQADVDEPLRNAAATVFPSDLTAPAVDSALESGLWHQNPPAVAVSIPRGNESATFIFVRQTDGTYSAADISWAARTAFGFWGFPREEIERFEMQPLTWQTNHNGTLMVRIRTRGWREGQRYTAQGLYLVSADGTVSGQ